MGMFRVRQAEYEADHKLLVKLAKSHPATKDFSNEVMFSSPEHYTKGWIRVIESHGEVVGFTCVRHKVRAAETTLYFIVISPEYRRNGIGSLLLDDLRAQTPHKRIVLKCMKDNLEALAFYSKHGFVVEADALNGKGVMLAKEW